MSRNNTVAEIVSASAVPAKRRQCHVDGTGDINWRGPLNAHLVKIISKEYHKFLSPSRGSSRRAVTTRWAKTLGISDKDPNGESVEQNTHKLVNAWMDANNTRNSTGFGDIKRDGIIVTRREQILEISEHYYDLEPTLGRLRSAAPRGGLTEAGVQGALSIQGSYSQFITDNSDDSDDDSDFDEDGPGILDAPKPPQASSSSAWDETKDPPATKKAKGPKGPIRRLTISEEDAPATDMNGEAKLIADLLSASNEAQTQDRAIAKLRAEAKLHENGGMTFGHRKFLEKEKEKDREHAVKMAELEIRKLEIQLSLARYSGEEWRKSTY
jgi:hypothetical protein